MYQQNTWDSHIFLFLQNFYRDILYLGTPQFLIRENEEYIAILKTRQCKA